MLELNGFKAWISVDSAELEQYDINLSGDSNTITCWIPSEAGKNFTVKWKDTSVRDITTGGTLSIDGTSIPGQATPRDFGTAEISSQLISGSKERPLLFTTVELTDDNSYLNSVSDHLGEIELQIWQIQHPSRAVITGSSDVRLKHKIHERSSKAAAHCIMLGDVVKTSKPMLVVGTVSKYGKSPLATFIFKYRPYDFLMARSIAPTMTVDARGSDPQCSGNKSRVDLQAEITDEKPYEEDNDDSEEIKALLRVVAGLREKHARSIGKRYQKKVKTEPVEQGGVANKMVIDLTWS